MSKSKRRGTAWESAIVTFLRDSYWPHAERRTLSGANDRGDIAGVIGVCIEAKDQARHSLAEWWGEAVKERDNSGSAIGVVWFKRRGKASARDGYVLMDGATFVKLLHDGEYGGQE